MSRSRCERRSRVVGALGLPQVAGFAGVAVSFNRTKGNNGNEEECLICFSRSSLRSSGFARARLGEHHWQSHGSRGGLRRRSASHGDPGRHGFLSQRLDRYGRALRDSFTSAGDLPSDRRGQGVQHFERNRHHIARGSNTHHKRWHKVGDDDRSRHCNVERHASRYGDIHHQAARPWRNTDSGHFRNHVN